MTDLFVRTERQRRFVDLAGQLADQFAPRAAQHDRENSFPMENVAELRAVGYHRLTVPVEFGGEGASLTEMLLAQERLAQGDGATALAIGWHLMTMGKLSETRSWPKESFERVCREVAGQGALINSVASEVATGSPSRGGRLTTTARRTADGWLLNGRKSFASLSPALSYAIVSARIDGEDGAGWFLLPMDTPGAEIVETWDTMGMRATASHDIALTDVAVPQEAFLEPIGKGKTCTISQGNGVGWLLHIPAAYLGIATAARNVAVDYARTRKTNALTGTIAEVPHVQALLGHIELDLFAARSALYTVAQQWDDLPLERDRLIPLVGAAKTVVTNNALSIVDKAMRVTGIAGLSRSLPLERYYRDVRAGLSNPPMDDTTLVSLARAAVAQREGEA